MDLNFSIDSNAISSKKNTLSENVIYDILVIGGGPSGLNSALYSKRSGLNVGIIADKYGGQILDTSSVENYLGYESLSGEELAKKFQKHISNYDIPIKKDSKVTNITKDNKVFSLILNDTTILKSKAVVIATGSKPRQLNVKGENEFLGKGVAYCAICDGPLFADRTVIVAGGGNSAVEAAMDLSKIASKVIIVHRSKFRAEKILVDKLKKIENIDIHLNTEIKEIYGKRLVSGIKALNKSNKEIIDIKADGVFVEIGYNPNSEPFKDLIELNEKGEIIIDGLCKTNIEGIFASGDVTNVSYKQISISSGEGAKAALSANQYINAL
ncbi:NAD(P)/FAD-dependent oxidoreductase [Helicovermis profundi]|uniref:FAD/NAD(P)-binding domain-containing protein n=1 Tax=Helicovermis profundi TaxID=3065157 RepID=A0AAU9ERL8_9FIRM|nr:hypothetical protein HLPR_23520 [Clostridia bacterium S502]